MNVRENLTKALSGEEPAITPLSAYDFFFSEKTRFQRLLFGYDFHLLKQNSDLQHIMDMGLALESGICTVDYVEHGVEKEIEEREEDGHTLTIQKWKTPVGTVRQCWTDGWQSEYLIKSPKDYTVLQWVVEHTELKTNYEAFLARKEAIGNRGLALVYGGRTPAMVINVEWAGTVQFCLDMALEVEEFFALYEALKTRFIQETKIIAEGPGKFVKWNENLSAEMIGPQRYNNLLVPVYQTCVPILERADKRVMVHYDGGLKVIKDQVASAPFHIMQSLTEPPEGDMAYDECRKAWPDKVFWGNINVDLYRLPPERLREEIIAMRERAGKKAFALQISESLPENWRESIPIVLQTLQQLG